MQEVKETTLVSRGYALAQANSNLTPEERKERAKKAGETRRNNNLKKKMLEGLLAKELKTKVKIKDPETGEPIYISKSEAIVKQLVLDAVNLSNKDRLDTIKFIFDKIDGKGNDTPQAEVNVNFRFEEMIKKVSSDDKW